MNSSPQLFCKLIALEYWLLVFVVNLPEPLRSHTPVDCLVHLVNPPEPLRSHTPVDCLVHLYFLQIQPDVLIVIFCVTQSSLCNRQLNLRGSDAMPLINNKNILCSPPCKSLSDSESYCSPDEFDWFRFDTFWCANDEKSVGKWPPSSQIETRMVCECRELL
jgi:hypothetical protein